MSPCSSDAFRSSADHAKSLRKQGGESVRYGLHFADPSELKKCADKLGLGHFAELGRFKITSIMHGTGSADLFTMMASLSWVLDSVEYIGEGHAIVSSIQCPSHNRICLNAQMALMCL